MKKEFNLQLDAHMELLQGIAYKSINGIKINEILELRNICKEDNYQYFNRIKLLYIIFLGRLGLEYDINQGIEKALFNYINYIIHILPVEKMECEGQININIL
ncbi:MULTISPECIES: hypothetical protein [Cytobacillus]|uniref:Uncharacterized protein n=1 Tax=Cytobacillus firmus TaxID=1399 RepID=A0AA46SKR7_CYTFI|nr:MULTISPECIES: hypothetical protein [Cytobacillus]MDF2039347.1 hypothetical protein [Cytobacillus oceanisediminis]UYG96755.1 hypothetical protein OD459_06915 [Cytobacillus firmus]